MRPQSDLLIVLLSCTFMATSTIAAQTLEEEIRAKRNQLIESANTASLRDAHLAQKKASNKVNALEQSVTSSQPSKLLSDDPAKKIVGYYRGTEGVPLPDSKTLAEKSIPSSVTSPKITSNVTKQYSTQLQVPREFPRCSDNGSKRVETGLTPQASEPAYDVLYLPPDLVPPEAGEVYGTKTRVRIVENPASPLVAFHLTEDSIPCIPFRVRIFDSAKIYDKGRNALKNFDRNPRGQGEFHAWVKEKIF